MFHRLWWKQGTTFTTCVAGLYWHKPPPVASAAIGIGWLLAVVQIELGVSILELSYCEDGEKYGLHQKGEEQSRHKIMGRNLVYDPISTVCHQQQKTPPKPSQKNSFEGRREPNFF